MERHIKAMIVGREPNDPGPKERRSREVKGPACVRRRKVERRLFALRFRTIRKIEEGNGDAQIGMDDLAQLAIDRLEGGAPDFMAAHNFGETSLQRGTVERAAAMNGQRLIVERNLGRHRGVQPDILLFGRDRYGIVRAAALDSG